MRRLRDGLRGVTRAALAGALLAAAAVGQAGFGPELTLHHSFPLAGSTLTLVLEGADPGETVLVLLVEPMTAPPSLLRDLLGHGLEGSFLTPSVLSTQWQADERGLWVLSVDLDDPLDADRPVHLKVQTLDGKSSDTLRLWVMPPTLLLPAPEGIERIDLRDGGRLLPPIPGGGGLQAVAVSSTGRTGYLLRQDGLLELWDPGRWDGAPRDVLNVDPNCDDLAGSRASGAAFLIARPQGQPFTPRGRLVFLDAPDQDLLLEPMGAAVAGRRWAVTDDGLTAFVAEDDLIVRTIDMLNHEVRTMLTVGFVGDREVTDMAIVGRRLFVAARRPLGRTGSVTTFDLDAGTLEVQPLDIDPLRLVTLGGSGVLVIPAAGPVFQVVDDHGLVVRSMAGEGTWLDAAPVAGGAVLLRETADSTMQVDLWRSDGGVTGLLAAVPPGRRLVSGGGGGIAVLLGDPDGGVWIVDVERAELRPVAGVVTLPGAPFAVFP